ncbi:Rv3235 family protein [Rhodococcus tukisamuensis]|uniref:Uncharacterized protein n=1 Tax=Rhodococcus tukisamuensis TaxID=168276 RepID=A0A1G6YHZ1_9NOCA|nr:Rv3235 family protein [Rhodococcus tukisamuensis]SDD89337.1 hypothetical protein SAMN05444580_107169 [Rhodococcus tukisamuensis]
MTYPDTSHPPRHEPPRNFLARAPQCEPPPHPRAMRPAPAAPSAAAHTASHTGRSPARRTPPPCADPAAHRFAETALRLVLEVLDRRRQPPQLRAVLSPAVVDLVAALTHAAPPANRLGGAQLQRVHLRPNGPDVAEVFGTYARGDRVFAIAGRVERTPAAPQARGGWCVTSLQVG